MRTLVVSACSARKLKDDGQLSLFGGMREYTARDRYQGRAHKRVLKAVDKLRRLEHEVSWSIVSAGKGLLDELDNVEEYNVTFRGLSEREAQRSGQALNLPADLRARAAEHDLVLLVLPKLYLAAVDAPLEESAELSNVLGPRHVYFATPRADLGDAGLHVHCGTEQAEGFGEPGLEIGVARLERFIERVRLSSSFDAALTWLASTAKDTAPRRTHGELTAQAKSRG